MPSLNLFSNTPLIWGHRGGRSLAAENTLRAIRLGREAGAHGCEIDVQFTRDGEVIVLHDLNLLRTTNACLHPLFADNKPTLPWRFTLEEIRKLSADLFPRRSCPRSSSAPWREVPDRVPEDVRVPTLTEVLRLVADLGMCCNIEIKDLSRAVPHELEQRIVEAVLDIVAAMDMAGVVIISSFNHDYIRRTKKLAPHILTGALTMHEFTGDAVDMLRNTGADAWHPGFRCLTRETVQQVRNAGLAINPYTVNDVEDMRRLIQWGVTGIVTDRPQDAGQ